MGNNAIPKKIVTVVGARPQFIKAAPVSKALEEQGVREILVHTGQHFDDNMSKVFFDEMGIPRPKYHLGLGGGTHGVMTGRMIEALESLFLSEHPDMVMVYGDTNSTLAGALAAVKQHIPVAHVEAGLRSFNRRMPEEINRVLTDHASHMLFCPTQTAMKNLAEEGIKDGGAAGEGASSFDKPRRVLLTGDVMYDAVLTFSKQIRQEGRINKLRSQHGVAGQYALCTVHRAENTDDPSRMRSIFDGLREVASTLPVLLPLHPRTRSCLKTFGLDPVHYGIKCLDPVGYLDMLALLDSCRLVFTDSGGLQKEAAFVGRPCVTLRSETEWVETVEQGWNVVVGADSMRIAAAVNFVVPADQPAIRGFGDGQAGRIIAGSLRS